MPETSGSRWLRAVNNGVVTTDGKYVYVPDYQLDKLCDELDATTRYANRLRELVQYAAANSSVTTSDEPGCFYCDHDDDAGHSVNCPAAIVLALPRTNPRRCITEFDWEKD